MSNPISKLREDLIIKEERDRIAKEVANAGMSKITLNDNKETFTGTYWVSANDIYRNLTGRHLNNDFEKGIIPRNRFMDELLNN